MFAKDASVTTHFPSSLKYFILTELRWLTAFISIEGGSFSAFACNTAVVAALLLTIPVSKTPFVLSLLFNTMYIIKRVRMFLIATRHYNRSIRNLFGFIVLSYAYHVVGFISHIRYLLGFSKELYLHQGQRY